MSNSLVHRYRNQIERFSSTVILIALDIMVALGIVFDWVWFYGLEVSLFIVYSFWLSIILIMGSILLLVGYQFLISSSWRRTQWKLNLFSQETMNKVAVVLFITSFFLIGVYGLEVRNLNDIHHIERNNSIRQDIWENNTWVYYLSGIENATSDRGIGVAFWLDMSYFENASWIVFAYYNGTSQRENRTRITDYGYPDERWFTEDQTIWYYHPESPRESPFGNSSNRQFQHSSIPAQAANTTVEYAFWVVTKENDTLSYTMRTGNYTVLYSDGENEYISELIRRSHSFVSFICWFTSANILLYFEIRKERTADFSLLRTSAQALGILETDIQKSSDGQVEYGPTISSLQSPLLSTEMMIQRSDRLDDIKNNIRTTSGAFIALSVAFLFYLEDVSLNNLLFWMSIGVYVAVLANLYILVLSLGEEQIIENGNTISYDLLPPANDPKKHRFLIFARINQQRNMISKMRRAMQNGVYFIICGLIADCVNIFLQTGDIMATHPLADLIFNLFKVILVFFVFMVSWWFIDRLGVEYKIGVE